MRNIILAAIFTAALDRFFENSAPSSPEALAVSAQSAALTPESSNEFSQAPAWFDVSKLKFDALVKSGTGGTAVMRYGRRNQFEMSVSAFPGDESVSFKEYSTNLRDPLYARMLEEMRTALAPAYVPGAPDSRAPRSPTPRAGS